MKAFRDGIGRTALLLAVVLVTVIAIALMTAPRLGFRSHTTFELSPIAHVIVIASTVIGAVATAVLIYQDSCPASGFSVTVESRRNNPRKFFITSIATSAMVALVCALFAWQLLSALVPQFKGELSELEGTVERVQSNGSAASFCKTTIVVALATSQRLRICFQRSALVPTRIGDELPQHGQRIAITLKRTWLGSAVMSVASPE
jgi:hypothetical protein